MDAAVLQVVFLMDNCHLHICPSSAPEALFVASEMQETPFLAVLTLAPGDKLTSALKRVAAAAEELHQTLTLT